MTDLPLGKIPNNYYENRYMRMKMIYMKLSAICIQKK